MARKTGANSQLLFVLETAYGVDPGGNYRKMRFVSDSLGGEQALTESDVIGVGRDPLSPFQDILRVTGDIVVPLEAQDIGYWLRLLLGAPTTVGTGDPYTHTFVSGAAALPSAHLEKGLTEATSIYLLRGGVMANSMRIEMSPSGPAIATFNLMGKSEVKSATSDGGTPPSQSTYERFNQFQGTIERNGSDVATITGGNFTYSNNLDVVEGLTGDGTITGLDPSVASINGEVTVRLDAGTFLDDAIAATPVALTFDYEISANRKLTFNIYEAHIQRPRVDLTGPGGVDVTYPFIAELDEAEGEMLNVVLVNELADFDNPV